MTEDRFARAEWRMDCLNERMDALAQERADKQGREANGEFASGNGGGGGGSSKKYAAVGGNAMRAATPAGTRQTQKNHHQREIESAERKLKGATKAQAVSLNSEIYKHKTALKELSSERSDADDPCWDGFEQRGTKEKGGETVPNCVKADETSNA